MNSTKNISFAQARNTQPEEFDLVILGGGTGSTKRLVGSRRLA